MRSCSQGVFRRAAAIGRPCLLGDIGKCAAPCVGRVTADEHRAIVDDFLSFMGGQTAGFTKRIEKRMREASDAQEYALAAQPRDDLGALQRVLEKQTVVLGDGTELGMTPILRRSVPSGEISYTVELENYEPFSGTITIHEDLLASVSHKLEPKPARLEVTSIPERAQIIVNKKLQDAVTPSTLSLRPGTYVVGLKVKGFVEAEKSIELGPNEQQTMHFELNVGEAPTGMVLVAGGEFICGVNNAAPDERPQRKVHLDAFFIDKYEVTNEQYQAVVPAHTFPEGQENYPVTGVTFQLATAYASAIGKRLPTELEWEKAARGTVSGSFRRPDRAGPRMGLLAQGASRRREQWAHPAHAPERFGSFNGTGTPCFGAVDLSGLVALTRGRGWWLPSLGAHGHAREHRS